MFDETALTEALYEPIDWLAYGLTRSEIWVDWLVEWNYKQIKRKCK